ncbi:DUF4192 domain-containing protein [Rhodococcoides corynebacterioides]|uniref:DUF4192 domain-containing protein n=1 Tax=Rhodococcoides corynebacterioides TaxID=53972 RepID=UPI000A54105B|nr:DUF4192 domain-containing protein [Rhodococcus corynebacterioides]
MTRHPYAAHRRDDHPLDPPLRATVATVGDLLAAVPALLGFVPESSLVLICLATGPTTTVRMTMRQDLTASPDAPDLLAAIERCALVCDREAFDTVVAVLITGDRAPESYEPVVDALRAAFDPLDIDVPGVHAVTTLVAGATWISLGGDPRRGILPDPRSSAVAASTVMRGRPIRPSRSELARLLAPTSETDRDRFARQCAVAFGDVVSEYPGEVLARVLDDLEADLDADGVVDAGAAARAMAALTLLPVRDALLGLAGGPLDSVAGGLWVELTRRVDGPDRAAPATMVAAWFYLRGDGPMAGVALEAALRADPGYRLAVLLDTALQNGLSPAVVLDLVESARGVATSLGVTLPTGE